MDLRVGARDPNPPREWWGGSTERRLRPSRRAGMGSDFLPPHTRSGLIVLKQNQRMRWDAKFAQLDKTPARAGSVHDFAP